MAVGHPFELNDQELMRNFWTGFESEPAVWQTVAPQIPGVAFGKETTKTFRWLELLSSFEDWTNLGSIPSSVMDKREYTLERKKYGRNLTIEEEEAEDDGGGMIYARAQGLGSGWPARQNYDVSYLIENAHQDRLLWDLQYFFDGAHPGATAAGVATTFPNKFQLELTRPNVQAILSTMATYRFLNGELVGCRPNLLLHPPALKFAAKEICLSPKYPDSANQGDNPMFRELLPVEMPNLTDINRFYIVDTTHPIKPFFWCPKQELRVILPNRQSDEYVKGRRLTYSADASGRFGVSLWWWAAMSDPDVSV